MRLAAVSLLCLWALGVAAQTPAPAPPPKWYFGSLRMRVEDWHFFDPGKGEGDYTFGSYQLRFGVRHTFGKTDAQVEIEQPSLFNLPAHAALPAPYGQLGFGASYYAANGTTTHPAGIFLKTATLSRKFANGQWRIGRFVYVDGNERTPADPTVAAVARERVAQRLVGPNAFSLGRTFDGGELRFGKGTLVALRPTAGSTTVHGGSELDVALAYASYIVPRKHSDSRFFSLLFHDSRDVVKVDNRPLAARTADTGDLTLYTLGADHVAVIGKYDVVAWGNVQFGDWGALRHRANAFALEGGWHGPVTIRAGYYRSSGDSNPSDGTHETWFPGVPTARTYGRFPFYNAMNSRDAFVQLSFKPRPTVTLAFETRHLGLTSSRDLWYSGGGASDDNTFGVSGRPANGHSDLANIVDGNIDWRINPSTTVTLYAAHANGGGVVSAIFKGEKANLVYLEVVRRF